MRPLCAPRTRPAPLPPASALRAEPSAPFLISPPPRGDPRLRSGTAQTAKQNQSHSQGQGQGQNLPVAQAGIRLARNHTPATETAVQAHTRPARNRNGTDRNRGNRQNAPGTCPTAIGPSGPPKGPRYAGHRPTRMTAVSRPTRNDTQRTPKLGQPSGNLSRGAHLLARSAERERPCHGHKQQRPPFLHTPARARRPRPPTVRRPARS